MMSKLLVASLGLFLANADATQSTENLVTKVDCTAISVFGDSSVYRQCPAGAKQILTKGITEIVCSKAGDCKDTSFTFLKSTGPFSAGDGVKLTCGEEGACENVMIECPPKSVCMMEGAQEALKGAKLICEGDSQCADQEAEVTLQTCTDSTTHFPCLHQKATAPPVLKLVKQVKPVEQQEEDVDPLDFLVNGHVQKDHFDEQSGSDPLDKLFNSAQEEEEEKDGLDADFFFGDHENTHRQNDADDFFSMIDNKSNENAKKDALDDIVFHKTSDKPDAHEFNVDDFFRSNDNNQHSNFFARNGKKDEGKHGVSMANIFGAHDNKKKNLFHSAFPDQKRNQRQSALLKKSSDLFGGKHHSNVNARKPLFKKENGNTHSAFFANENGGKGLFNRKHSSAQNAYGNEAQNGMQQGAYGQAGQYGYNGYPPYRRDDYYLYHRDDNTSSMMFGIGSMVFNIGILCVVVVLFCVCAFMCYKQMMQSNVAYSYGPINASNYPNTHSMSGQPCTQVHKNF